LQPILPNVTKNISNPELIQNEEDILSYCLFPEVAIEFFKWRALPKEKRPSSPADIEEQEFVKSKVVAASPAPQETMKPLLNADDYTGLNAIIEKASRMQLSEITIRKGEFNLSLRSGNGSSGKVHATYVDERIAEPAAAVAVQEMERPKAAEAVDTSETIKAVMAGTFYRSASEKVPAFVEVGSVVNAGDTICILEAMKLFNEIQSPMKCKVLKILVDNGTKVTKGQPLMAIEKL
jgi:acetyl-CoA carboxylase biotin carboxyl carrier protein